MSIRHLRVSGITVISVLACAGTGWAQPVPDSSLAVLVVGGDDDQGRDDPGRAKEEREQEREERGRERAAREQEREQEREGRAYDQGREFIDDGKYDRAIERF